MIHSLCGGKLRDNQIFDVAKVRFINNPLSGERPYWYKSSLHGLKEGDKVTAPFGKSEQAYIAVVIKIDKNVNEQNAPMVSAKTPYLIDIVSAQD